jgi:Zn finger protein HypA/HybF involved in hydrogenase expression
MPAPAFFAQFGFTEDPLESTNAESEPLLNDYFVPPPYFPTLLGNPARPQSHIILAPRGGGKTAQRRMIETQSETDNFLCVTYDASEQPPGTSLTSATWAFHIRLVAQRLLVALLLAIEEDRFQVDLLSVHQRHVLRASVDAFLGPLSEQEFHSAVSAVKTFGQRASDFWRTYAGPISAAIQVLMNKAGLGNLQVPQQLNDASRRDDQLRYYFEQLLQISHTLGFSSTYFLVDKVDESSATEGNAAATFDYIRAILTDLPTLETPHACFKFFLWDRIEDLYRENGGRPDRVPILVLHWTVSELATMLERRLAAYSAGRITSLNQLLEPNSEVDFHRLSAYLGNGSPRDMIRFAKTVTNEATKRTVPLTITSGNIWVAVISFSAARAQELSPGYLSDLRKIGVPSFTINYLANDVFHISVQAARNKIQNWVNAGIVQRIGQLPNPGNRPMHLYALADLRLAVAASTGTDVQLVLDNYTVECPNCKMLVITAELRATCPDCSTPFSLTEAKSLLRLCSRSDDHLLPDVQR